uniref:RRM domain-containing protein n=1 Tax=Pinguiococcus pyrenoidosus TaxID=172671 RepID=A0A7R9UCK7_9STRA
MPDAREQDTVFARQLPFDWTEEHISEVFSSVGPVKRVDLIRDSRTRASKGFAFVRFATETDAEAAVAQLHQQKKGGRQIHVEIAERKKTGRGNRDRFKGKEELEKYGRGRENAVAKDGHGAAGREDEADAEEMQGTEAGRERQTDENVEKAATPARRKAALKVKTTELFKGCGVEERLIPFCTAMLYGIKPGTSAKQVYKRLRKLGGFKKLHVHDEPESQDSKQSAEEMDRVASPRGLTAEVLFASPKETTAALKRLDDSTICGASVKARRRVEGAPASDIRKSRQCRLIVRNLHFRASEDDLLKVFGRFGPIREAHIPKVGLTVQNKSGEKVVQRSRGFGFVQFIYKKDAIQAVESSADIAIRNRDVAVDFSQSKSTFAKEKQSELDFDAEQEAEQEAEDGEAGEAGEMALNGATAESSAKDGDVQLNGSTVPKPSDSS